MDNRENGFYWVKMNGEWLISEWNYNSWLLTFEEISHNDEYFEEIDERQITRESFEKSRLAMLQIEAFKAASKAIDAALNIIQMPKKSFKERIEEMKNINNG